MYIAGSNHIIHWDILMIPLATVLIEPIFFTTEEGGTKFGWDLLVHGQVTRLRLLRKLQGNSVGKKAEKVLVNGIPVHSLFFIPWKFGKEKVYPRWDCYNGWTTVIPEGRRE